MKKLLAAIISLTLCVTMFFGCTGNNVPSEKPDNSDTDIGTGGNTGDDIGNNTGNNGEENQPLWYESLSSLVKDNLSADGYVKENIGDFSQYENTDSYRTVSTADELITALADAKYHYTNVWDDETKTYTQIPAEGYTEENFEGKVRVIEITQDLNLGYYKLSETAKANTSIVEDFCRKNANQIAAFTMSDMFTENGISQIKVENTSNLLIYSKNGAKLTHCGFKLTSDTNVVFRNLQFDEIWQWEDAASATTGAVGDYDAFGWAYFKIAFCGYVWIDHCSFGKSYDGQIDYSNPVYNSNAGTAFRAPYGATGENGLHISWCSFNSGSDDKDGYLYKMMDKIEQEYQEGKQNYLYYNALRDAEISFDDILYGIAIPQKKGFLCGDNAKYGEDDYNYNLKLQVSFANCKFINLEDRIPKLRGGNAVVYNCLVDSSQYLTYRTRLRGASAASAVTKVNGSWKCGLVSQCILSGNDGSVFAQSCVFLGVDTLLKNNDSQKGGYRLINCRYQRSAGETEAIGSTTDATNPFPSNASNLTVDNFSWHTVDGEQPFAIAAMRTLTLVNYLDNETYGTGVKQFDTSFLLKSDIR